MSFKAKSINLKKIMIKRKFFYYFQVLITSLRCCFECSNRSDFTMLCFEENYTYLRTLQLKVSEKK